MSDGVFFYLEGTGKKEVDEFDYSTRFVRRVDYSAFSGLRIFACAYVANC
jgi:hypothetical protein